MYDGEENTQIDPLLQAIRKLRADMLVCWPDMKMERKNDYKDTYPHLQWPLHGYGKGNSQSTRDSEKPMLYGDSFQVKQSH